MDATITLDPDVAQLIDETMHRERKSLNEVVNDAVRRGLLVDSVRPFVVKAHVAELVAGYDLQGFNRLADDLEDLAMIGKTRP